MCLARTTQQTAYYFAEGNSSTGGFRELLDVHHDAESQHNDDGQCDDYVLHRELRWQQSGLSNADDCAGPLQRGTASPAFLSPPLHAKVAISVIANQPIVVERPLYFKDNIPNGRRYHHWRGQPGWGNHTRHRLALRRGLYRREFPGVLRAGKLRHQRGKCHCQA